MEKKKRVNWKRTLGERLKKKEPVICTLVEEREKKTMGDTLWPG